MQGTRAVVHISCDDDRTVRVEFNLGRKHLIPALPEGCEFIVDDYIFEVAHHSYNVNIDELTIYLRDEEWLEYDSDQLIEEMIECRFVSEASIDADHTEEEEPEDEEESAVAIAKPAHTRR